MSCEFTGMAQMMSGGELGSAGNFWKAVGIAQNGDAWHSARSDLGLWAKGDFQNGIHG